MAFRIKNDNSRYDSIIKIIEGEIKELKTYLGSNQQGPQGPLRSDERRSLRSRHRRARDHVPLQRRDPAAPHSPPRRARHHRVADHAPRA